MKYSHLFSKTLKVPPKEADTINHKLLTQSGFVEQLMAGVYSYLPLGLKVLRNIEQIVRIEMDNIGGQEVLMPILHPKLNWQITGGWDNIDVLFKINSRTEKEYALGQSEEEVVTPLVKSRVNSYKDLPISIYQIHWKYRDELRAKSGIMRGREFFMKDMYSFHETEEDFLKYYEQVKKAYLKIFEKLGLVAKVTEASGGSFSKKVSYEFMVLTSAGEDEIIYCPACDYCVNSEIADSDSIGAEVKVGEKCHRCGSGVFQKDLASEVGNVFDLGKKYPVDFDFEFVDKEGKKQNPTMGCYGIGISRVMGVIVEKFNDSKGIIWPESIAPFKVHLIGLDLADQEIYQRVEKVYKLLQVEGIDVLFDDRVDISPGQKFAEADLIGVPYRVVMSRRSGDKLEVKKRAEDNINYYDFKELIEFIK